jgi:hypothetical protein
LKQEARKPGKNVGRTSTERRRLLFQAEEAMLVPAAFDVDVFCGSSAPRIPARADLEI